MGLAGAWRALWRDGRATDVPEGKASRAGPLVALHMAGQPALLPRRYDSFADEGYRKNVIAFRAINEVARGIACVPWLLYRHDARGGREELSGHPLLALLKRPNPAMGQSAFFEAVAGFFLIAGNSYVEAAAPNPSAPPRELWPLRPDRMAVIKSKTGLPGGYEYRVGGELQRWSADPLSGRSAVLHLKAFHPLDDWYGLSPLEAAAYGIDQHNEAGKWNTALLQNSGRPSGALVYKPSVEGAADSLSDEQFARLEAQFEARVRGAANAGRPLILEGGLTWQEMGLKPRDMDFLRAKHTAARDIALAFGVPPQLLGIPGDNTYSNYQEARLALWEETVVPLLRQLRDELNGWLAPRFGPDLELDIDLDEVPALTLRRERRWDMLLRAVERGVLTRDEAREGLGYGPFSDAIGGDAPGGEGGGE
jgi:HK97 family phage portal protein